MKKLTETTLSKETKYTGRIVNIRVDDILLPDGKPAKREVCEHPGGVGVLPVVDGGVVLVRQFRYPYGEELIEIPAGKLEKGEEHEFCGLRELREETGLRPVGRSGERFLYLGKLYPSPGFLNEVIHLYLALGFAWGKDSPDEGEFVNLVKMSWEEFRSAVETGEIRDAKTIAACARAARYLEPFPKG